MSEIKTYLKQRPRFPYKGLTIILSNPSRHCVMSKKLLEDASGGWFFEKECLRNRISRWSCEIRLADDDSPLLPNTKCLLLLGEYAHKKLSGLNTSLDENRGSPYYVNGLPTICSFFPQDCVDRKNFEKTKNPEYKTEEDISEASFTDDISESKQRGRTDRKNYGFWLRRDTDKILDILENDGKIPLSGYTPRYHIQPDEKLVVKLLKENKNQYFYYDHETDPITGDIRCFAFSFSNNPEDVYVVPTLDTRYVPVYSYWNSLIHVALSVAIRDNIIVAHNGAHFDFFILANKYRIPIKRAWDTMLAQHKRFPTIEKSLGHCISLDTFEPYHKDEGVHSYYDYNQAQQLYKYCGKDVFSMFLVHKRQLEVCAEDPGLKASIEQSNDSIRPYLTNTLMGVHFNEQRRQEWIKESDRLCTFFFKVIQQLTGPSVEPLISNKKCVEYFHNMLAYPVVKRTPTGGISCDEAALQKLALKYPNPVISFLLKYRGKQKEVSTLQFKVWRKEKK